MKKMLSLFLALICFILIITACSKTATEKSEIISLFQEEEEVFLKAADSGDYSAVEKLKGVQSIYISDKYVEISCGAAGFGSNTHYYGLFYSDDDNMYAMEIVGPEDEMRENGEGYLYQEEGGDNRYYVESLGNGFYYYEAHF